MSSTLARTREEVKELEEENEALRKERDGASVEGKLRQLEQANLSLSRRWYAVEMQGTHHENASHSGSPRALPNGNQNGPFMRAATHLR